MQQLPKIEKVDFKSELSCIKSTINNGRRKLCRGFKTDMDNLSFVVYRYGNNTYVKYTELELKLTEYAKLLSKRVYLLSYIDVFFRRCFVLDETSVLYQSNLHQEWMFFSHEHFPTVPGMKRSFEHNSFRKNLFLSACFCWDSRLCLREMDQKIEFGRNIGYEDSYLDSVVGYFNLFRLHAILHDEGPGYCHMIGRGPNCCLLGHVTGLLFCLYIKIILTSIFNIIDFWTSMFLY